jgi:hypothetical protein
MSGRGQMNDPRLRNIPQQAINNMGGRGNGGIN